jgi:hypothetical protein
MPEPHGACQQIPLGSTDRSLARQLTAPASTVSVVTATSNSANRHAPAPSETEVWHEYIRAAERKVRIARYHLDRLQELPTHSSQPSIGQQAHFEGVITAFVGAIEQVAGAIYEAGGGGRDWPKLSPMLDSIHALPVHGQLEEWNGEAIVRDVSRIRNRAAHRYYSKAVGEVQRPSGGTDYGGSRQLLSYCSAAVRHLESLAPLLARLEEELERSPLRGSRRS